MITGSRLLRGLLLSGAMLAAASTGCIDDKGELPKGEVDDSSPPGTPFDMQSGKADDGALRVSVSLETAHPYANNLKRDYTLALDSLVPSCSRSARVHFASLRTEPGEGSTFSMHLPRANDPRAALPAECVESATQPCSGTILLVDDEPAVLELCAGGLRARGYTVLCARDGEEARSICARHPCAIDLLVCDLVLPKTNGADVARAVQSTRPNLRTLFISGYADSRIVRGLCMQDGMELLAKPFTPAQLVERVQSMLSGEVRQQASISR